MKPIKIYMAIRIDSESWDQQPQICLGELSWKDAINVAREQDKPTRLSESVGFNNQGHYFNPNIL